MHHRPTHVSRGHAQPSWLKLALLAGLLLVPSLAQALLLNRPLVHAILGQPLRVDIPVRLDAGEQLATRCVQVQADAGSDPLRADQLQIGVQPEGSSMERIQVRSTMPMTEPFVVLTLKLGCQYQRSQQYTILVNPPTPELPVLPGEAAATARLPQHPGSAASTPRSASPEPVQSATAAAQSVLAGGFGARQGTGHNPAPARAKRQPDVAANQDRQRYATVQTDQERRQRHPAAMLARMKQTHTAQGASLVRHAGAKPESQLKLDWLSAALVPAPDLRISTTLALPAVPITPAQRKVYAQLRTIVMDGAAAPGEPLRSGQKLSALEAQVSAPDANRLQDGRKLAVAQARLIELERTRYPASWTYGLLGLCALLALITLWLWRDRLRRAAADAHWFASEAQISSQHNAAAQVQAPASVPVPVPTTHPARMLPPGTAPASDQPVWEVSGPSTWPPAQPLGAAAADAAAAGSPASTRPQTTQPAEWGQALSLDKEVFSRPLSGQEQVQVDEMMDIGHLADFFISIGSPEQAIEVMEKALGEVNGGTQALPCLYLFELYRQTGRKDDYEVLLARFSHRFNVQIPPWDHPPSGEARELEAYPRAIALICETWDLAPMLTVIERMLLDDPAKPRVGFDLPAYRDLLDLYAVARDLHRHSPESRREAEQALPRVSGLDGGLDLPLVLNAHALDQGASRQQVSAPPELAPLDFTLDELSTSQPPMVAPADGSPRGVSPKDVAPTNPAPLDTVPAADASSAAGDAARR